MAQYNVGRVRGSYIHYIDSQTDVPLNALLDDIGIDTSTWDVYRFDGNAWIYIDNIHGAAAGFDTPSASATTLAAGSQATVSVSSSGPDTAKKFDFTFGIPGSPIVTATVDNSEADLVGQAHVEVTNTGTTYAPNFEFAFKQLQGVGVQTIAITYQQGDSATVVPTGTWSDTPVEAADGTYLWTRYIFNKTDGTSATAYSVAKQGSPASTVDVTAINGLGTNWLSTLQQPVYSNTMSINGTDYNIFSSSDNADITYWTPVTNGTTGQVLTANSNNAPTWKTLQIGDISDWQTTLDGRYLPLSAGSGKPLTGELYVPQGIKLTSGIRPYIRGYGDNALQIETNTILAITGSDHITVNFDTPPGGYTVPTSWIWRAGTSSSLADFTIGELSTTNIENTGNLSNEGEIYTPALITAESGIQIGTNTLVGVFPHNDDRLKIGKSRLRGALMGSLLTSNTEDDSTKVPTNGIYSKGPVISEDSFVVGRDYNTSDGQWGYTFNYNNESITGVGTLYSSGNIVVYSNMRPKKDAAGWEWSGTTGKGIALHLNRSQGTVELLYNNSTSSTVGSAVTPTAYTLATQDWVNEQLTDVGAGINFSPTGSGTAYLVTGASGNTVTGRGLTVNDINGFTSPNFRMDVSIYASATTSAWARGFFIKNNADATQVCRFGGYGSNDTTGYAYVSSGTNIYSSSEILKVYPTNITFGDRPLAIWGDRSVTSYDTYKLYKQNFTINGTVSNLITNAPYSSSVSIFAPTTAGTSGQILQSNGSGKPSWVNPSTLSVGTASKLGTTTVGSSTKPVYLDAGTPKACGSSLGVSITGNAATVGGYSVSVVSALPSSPSSTTIYLVTD